MKPQCQNHLGSQFKENVEVLFRSASCSQTAQATMKIIWNKSFYVALWLCSISLPLFTFHPSKFAQTQINHAPNYYAFYLQQSKIMWNTSICIIMTKGVSEELALKSWLKGEDKNRSKPMDALMLCGCILCSASAETCWMCPETCWNHCTSASTIVSNIIV